MSIDCKICGKSFDSTKYLKHHITRTHGKFQIICSYCLKHFSRKDNLLQHTKNVHQKLKTKSLTLPLIKKKCPFCNEDMVGNSDVYFFQHLSACIFNPINKQKHHSPFLCNYCHKVFKNQRNLILHKSRFHNVEFLEDIYEKDIIIENVNKYKDELIRGEIDPDLLYNISDTDKVWSKNFNAMSYRSLFTLTPLAMQLSGIGLLLECVTLVLKALLSLTKMQENIFAIQISLDNPLLLETPISSALQLVERFSLNALLTQLENVMYSKKTLGISSPLILEVKIVYDSQNFSGKGLGGNLSAKRSKKISEYLSNRHGLVDVSRYQLKHLEMKNACGLLCIIFKLFIKSKRTDSWITHTLSHQVYGKLKQLYSRCSMTFGTEVGSEDFVTIDTVLRKYYNYQLAVYDVLNLKHIAPIFILRPHLPPNRRIILFFHAKHFFLVNSIQFLHGIAPICTLCGFLKFKQHKCHMKEWVCFFCKSSNCNSRIERVPNLLCHICNNYFAGKVCFELHKPKICKEYQRCTYCFKNFKTKDLNPNFHKCEKFFCKNCWSEKTSKNHQCFIQSNVIKSPPEGTKMFFADFETEKAPGSNIHKVSLAIIFKTCVDCINLFDQEYFLCCGKRESVFYGNDALKNFNDYLFFTPSHKNSVCFFHYGSKFDSLFIIKDLNARGHTPRILSKGRKILLIEAGYTVKIKDSYCFLSTALANFPKLFDTAEPQKTFFPHKLAIGAECFDLEEIDLPLPKEYGFTVFDSERAEEFIKWYRHRLSINPRFKFKEEYISYCRSDVSILHQAMSKFREQMLKITGLDPLYCSITLAQFVGICYRNCFLKSDFKIPKISDSTTTYGFLRQKQSKIAIIWMDFLATINNISIKHAGNSNNEMRIGKYRVDGFSNNKTVYEFLGCVFHACFRCHKFRFHLAHPFCSGLRYRDVYAKTLIRLKNIENSGFRVIRIWECQFNKLLKSNPILKKFKTDETNYLHLEYPIKSIREGYYGGRVNPCGLWCKLSPEDIKMGYKIYYYDINNLYGFQMKINKFPCGVPEMIAAKDISKPISEYFGLIKAKILPPQDLFFGILPYRHPVLGILMFPLCKACCLRLDQNKVIFTFILFKFHHF